MKKNSEKDVAARRAARDHAFLEQDEGDSEAMRASLRQKRREVLARSAWSDDLALVTAALMPDAVPEAAPDNHQAPVMRPSVPGPGPGGGAGRARSMPRKQQRRPGAGRRGADDQSE